MPENERTRSLLTLARCVLLVMSGILSLMFTFILLPASPAWLRNLCLLCALALFLAAVRQFHRWHQELYVPALEVYFYDRDAWDET